MTKATTASIETAKRLLRQEGGSLGSTGERVDAAGRIYAKLFERFAPILGDASTHALSVRSAKMAAADFPCLALMSGERREPYPSSVTLDELVACPRLLDSEAASEVAAGLLARLFALVTTLVGEHLTHRVLTRAFP